MIQCSDQPAWDTQQNLESRVDSTTSEACCSRRKAGTRRRDWAAKQQLSPQIKEKIANSHMTIFSIKKKKIKSKNERTHTVKNNLKSDINEQLVREHCFKWVQRWEEQSVTIHGSVHGAAIKDLGFDTFGRNQKTRETTKETGKSWKLIIQEPDSDTDFWRNDWTDCKTADLKGFREELINRTHDKLTKNMFTKCTAQDYQVGTSREDHFKNSTCPLQKSIWELESNISW